MTRCLAIDLGEHRIRVNCISPGGIMTPIFLGGRQHRMTAAEVERAVTRLTALYDERIPLRRAGTPDDIANAAVYLASDESRHVTGENLVVDAGTWLGRSASIRHNGRRGGARRCPHPRRERQPDQPRGDRPRSPRPWRGTGRQFWPTLGTRVNATCTVELLGRAGKDRRESIHRGRTRPRERVSCPAEGAPARCESRFDRRSSRSYNPGGSETDGAAYFVASHPLAG